MDKGVITAIVLCSLIVVTVFLSLCILLYCKRVYITNVKKNSLKTTSYSTATDPGIFVVSNSSRSQNSRSSFLQRNILYESKSPNNSFYRPNVTFSKEAGCQADLVQTGKCMHCRQPFSSIILIGSETDERTKTTPISNGDDGLIYITDARYVNSENTDETDRIRPDTASENLLEVREEPFIQLKTKKEHSTPFIVVNNHRNDERDSPPISPSNFNLAGSNREVEEVFICNDTVTEHINTPL
ncbi:DgyrCDS8089 [Dimorphilus gyrociliatus]|uniref:DgyrCDS8089 n=1 Tax=Dimorphilus gyrociliatus TaxID=2664684 RepID=A0A7I8VT50_9ANNE|nr:DgyrCDS8089 [Dimorphilus gyrociliatus]